MPGGRGGVRGGAESAVAVLGGGERAEFTGGYLRGRAETQAQVGAQVSPPQLRRAVRGEGARGVRQGT